MNILHLVAGDLSGGAARGALWLHNALLALGVDSRILTNSRKTYNSAGVQSIADNKVELLKSMVRARVDYLPTRLYKGKRRIFSTGFCGYDFTRTQLYREADLIHLHWINGGFVNLSHLEKVKKPVVWTLRDMWPMTGGCHCALGCDRYKSGCGYCRELSSSHKYDLSRFVMWRKKRKLPRNMKIVGISRWLSDCARNGSLFKDYDVRTIPNNIDCQSFSPVDKNNARKILGLPAGKKIILAGAQSLQDIWKGFDLYIKSLRYIKQEDCMLVFFGNIERGVLANIGFDYTIFGFLHDTVSLRLAYSAADVFVAPSTMEAFGKTIAESMSCGTPVVCFNATGPKDIVDHKKNGYLATPFEPRDLARGIEWVLDNENYSKLCANARTKVVNTFDSRLVARQYMELYEQVCLGK